MSDLFRRLTEEEPNDCLDSHLDVFSNHKDKKELNHLQPRVFVQIIHNWFISKRQGKEDLEVLMSVVEKYHVGDHTQVTEGLKGTHPVSNTVCNLWHRSSCVLEIVHLGIDLDLVGAKRE